MKCQVPTIEVDGALEFITSFTVRLSSQNADLGMLLTFVETDPICYSVVFNPGYYQGSQVMLNILENMIS